MKNLSITVEQIDACLPQTQCRECGYNGCLPYAKAMQAGAETIDKCPPGGLNTLQNLSQLLGVEATPYVSKVEAQTRPQQVVTIDETTCIGCTKCIQACPVDAIIGSAKQMHTVISQHCTGCQLCIEPCPVDCIDLVPMTEKSIDESQQFVNQSRLRYQQREKRLNNLKQQRRQKHLQAKNLEHQKYIAQAIERVKRKREEF